MNQIWQKYLSKNRRIAVVNKLGRTESPQQVSQLDKSQTLEVRQFKSATAICQGIRYQRLTRASKLLPSVQHPRLIRNSKIPGTQNMSWVVVAQHVMHIFVSFSFRPQLRLHPDTLQFGKNKCLEIEGCQHATVAFRINSLQHHFSQHNKKPWNYTIMASHQFFFLLIS